jgi:TonB family protein
MTRFLLCVLFTVFCFGQTLALPKDTLYYSKNREPLKNKKGAEYFSTVTFLNQERNTREEIIYHISGVKYAVENQSKSTKKKSKDYPKHGLSTYFAKTGELHQTIVYKDGLKHGAEKTYHPGGKTIAYTTEYAGGLKHGPALAYYPDGKIKREEIFWQNKLGTGKCFTRSGADTTYFPKDLAPSFVGGDEGLNKFIKMTLRYPAEALRTGADGQVVISFTVYKDGTISEPVVTKSAHVALDAEALRVILLTKNHWRPGAREGIPADRKKTIPIRFGMQKSIQVNRF